MSGNYQKLTWRETKNDISIDCSLDVAVHPADSKIILLIIPGVDGSVDGFEKKYIQIADSIQAKHAVAVVRMSNPFISSFHWESNVRHILEFIQDNLDDIAGNEDVELRIMSHSAGASIIAQIAWEYPFISRLLLINLAMRLNPEKIKKGLSEFKNENLIIVVGSQDQSLTEIQKLSSIKTIVIDGADHNFSGDTFPIFLELADKYLFNYKDIKQQYEHLS